MPKLKTRKSISKRFKFTKTGKVLRRVTGQDHNLRKQTAKSRRNKRKLVSVSASEAKVIKRALKG